MRNKTTPGLLRRLAAMTYDLFLVLPLIMAAVAVATLIAVSLTGESVERYEATLHPALVQSIALACTALFFGYFWRLKGQTLGMQAWRLKLVSRRSEEITVAQVVIRCLGAAVSAAALGLGYLWCLIDRQGLSWHDHLSGTALELLPKKDKNPG